MNNENRPSPEWSSWTRQEYCKDDGGLHTSLCDALVEVEETTELIHQPLRALTDTGPSYSVLQNLLLRLLNCIRHVMAVDTVTVLLQTKDRQDLAVHATLGLEEEITQGIRIPIGCGFAGRVAVRNELCFVDDLSTVEVVSPILRNKGIRSMLGVPLLVEDRAVGVFHGGTVRRAIGVFHVGTIRPRKFTKTEAWLLEFIAERIGRTICNLEMSSS